MGDTIRIEHGFRPWQPDHGSEIIEVLAQFDVPTAGVLAQGGHNYLFWCVEGINEPVSVWAYSLLEHDEVEDLNGIEEPIKGFQRVSQLMVARPVTLAVATDEGGIAFTASTILEEGHSVGDVVRRLLEVASRALDGFAEQLRSELERPKAAV